MGLHILLRGMVIHLYTNSGVWEHVIVVHRGRGFSGLLFSSEKWIGLTWIQKVMTPRLYLVIYIGILCPQMMQYAIKHIQKPALRSLPNHHKHYLNLDIDYWYLLMSWLIGTAECHQNEPQISYWNSNRKDLQSSDTWYFDCVEPCVFSDNLLSELLAFCTGFALAPFIVSPWYR